MNKISLKLAKAVADKLEIKFDKFSLKQFCYGMNVETEHGSKDKKTQIVKNDNPMIFGKIALAHLNEFPDYYIRLNRMEKQAKKDQKILKENPDKINLNGIRQDKRDVELLWYDNDAYTFGYFDNIFYIESGGIKHRDLKNDMGEFDRDDLKHAGRFWLKNHVISFWNTINANDLKKLIKDVYKKVQIKIENDWYIEYDYNKFKTIGEFTGETIKSKDINSDHTTPPMYKIKKPIKGFGSDKYNKLAVKNHYNSVAQMNYYNKNKYMKTENAKLIKEDPDRITVGDKKLYRYDNDVYTFGYYTLEYYKRGSLNFTEETRNLPRKKIKLKFLIGKFPGHKELRDFEEKEAQNEEDNNFLVSTFRDTTNCYDGRFWLKSKTISFWRNVTPRKLQLIIKDIYKETKIIITDDWLIEVRNKNTQELQKIGNYLGKNKVKDVAIADRHVLSPMSKVKKDNDGFGSEKYKKLAMLNKYNSVAQMNYYNKNKYANEQYKITKKVLLEIIRKFIK